ncbi:MAG: hemerythrin domain-containing protein, partial [Sulfobacillus sp.]
AALYAAAVLVFRFIESYHEKVEEDYVFPVVARATDLGPTVNLLRLQHAAGRRCTKTIMRECFKVPTDPRALQRIVQSARQFIRMYRPHEAREDTEVFPAFRKALSASEYREYGKVFEAIEKDLFGPHGDKVILQEVIEIEKSLGIDALEQFTSRC